MVVVNTYIIAKLLEKRVISEDQIEIAKKEQATLCKVFNNKS